MASKEHWEQVYTNKLSNEVSWFQEHAAVSLRLIRDAGTPLSASIIDIGGGASTLVDDLLQEGFSDITVLDLSGKALASAKSRLGIKAAQVHWREANVLNACLPYHTYDVWHDRAVFHFLTTRQEREAYVQAVLHAVKPGGFVVVATFAEDGPTKCSGLPVMRYDEAGLHEQFGQAFDLLGSERETHHTPAGNAQEFVYCFFRKRDL
ncbi:MAG TPA: class I SAM-dependent methyltransferase [Pseudomonadales bacterium]|nr:class I SAM-dependent methyltransferase [Pseudomonadales bacterium]